MNEAIICTYKCHSFCHTYPVIDLNRIKIKFSERLQQKKRLQQNEIRSNSCDNYILMHTFFYFCVFVQILFYLLDLNVYVYVYYCIQI